MVHPSVVVVTGTMKVTFPSQFKTPSLSFTITLEQSNWGLMGELSTGTPWHVAINVKDSAITIFGKVMMY